jgi:hypothetical protein
MSRKTWEALLDLLIRLYRRGDICPKCAAVVAWETRR